MALRYQTSDLLARPGSARSESGEVPISVDLTSAAVHDIAVIDVGLRSLSDGVVVRGSAAVAAELCCIRCLTQWTEQLVVPVEAVFRVHPDDEDDELPVESGGWIDLAPVVHDEVSLALPERPVCREDCAGLCATCGTDLNTDPCDGHGDAPDSPFAALKELLGEDGQAGS
jgi:uncharacterized protein